MSVRCKKITFEMEEDGQVWNTVLSLEELIDITVEQRFTPENFGEEIKIFIQRHTHQSRQYADYVRRISKYEFE